MQLRLLDKKIELTQDKMNIVQDFLKFCIKTPIITNDIKIERL
jgi:hypothetical protein